MKELKNLGVELDGKAAVIGFSREKLERKWVYIVGVISGGPDEEFSIATFCQECVWSFFSWGVGWSQQGPHWASDREGERGLCSDSTHPPPSSFCLQGIKGSSTGGGGLGVGSRYQDSALPSEEPSGFALSNGYVHSKDALTHRTFPNCISKDLYPMTYVFLQKIFLIALDMGAILGVETGDGAEHYCFSLKTLNS